MNTDNRMRQLAQESVQLAVKWRDRFKSLTIFLLVTACCFEAFAILRDNPFIGVCGCVLAIMTRATHRESVKSWKMFMDLRDECLDEAKRLEQLP